MFRRLLSWSVLLLAVHGLTSSAHANLILNGGFEEPFLALGSTALYVNADQMPSLGSFLASGATPDGNGGPHIGAWRVVGPSVVLVQTRYGEPERGVTMFTAQEGFNSIDLTGPGNAGFGCGVEQTVATIAGRTYDLMFFVGRAAGTNNSYAAPAIVDLSIDGGPRLSYTNAGLTPGTVNWAPFKAVFTAKGAATTISFYNGTPSPTAEAGLDNVTLMEVPEPAAAILFLLGGAAGVITTVTRSRRSR